MRFKAILNWIMCLSLFFCLSAEPTYAASGKTVKVKVTFVSAELQENNHVGNQWYTGLKVNGSELSEGTGKTFTLKLNGSLKVQAIAEEQDKIPDTGSNTMTIKASSIKKTADKSLSVTVTENRGRYSGNTATWKFVVKVQKQ